LTLNEPFEEFSAGRPSTSIKEFSASFEENRKVIGIFRLRFGFRTESQSSAQDDISRILILMPKQSTKAKVLSSRTVYRGPVFWVTSDKVREPSGITVRRDVVRHSGSVVVLAVDDAHREPRVLLLRQYRHAAQQYLWELCAGRIDPGENELAAAKRELLEETGYSARHWKHILTFYASPGFVAETMSVYLARDLRAGTAEPEEDEVIDLKFLPLSKAAQWIVSGVIKDAKTIAGVLWLRHKFR
jgi:ADP-ribose pyrophosphatase